MKNILIANNVSGFNNTFIVDALLSEALADKGANVYFSYCDGVFSSCLNCKYDYVFNGNFLDNFRKFEKWKLSKGACARCHHQIPRMPSNRVNLINLSDHIDHERVSRFFESEKENLFKDNHIMYRDVNVTEHAYAGTVRFFANGRPEHELKFKDVFLSYFFSAVQSVESAYSLMQQYSIDVLVAHHGIYVPQGPFVDVAKIMNKRVITWLTGGRKGTFLFCDDDTYHKEFPSRPIKLQSLSSEQRKRTLAYLTSRETGKNDWIKFHNNLREPIPVVQDIRAAKPEVKIFTAFTNVFWDAQLHFKDNIFENMLDWLDETIKLVEGNDKVFLIIREHPGELLGQQKSRKTVTDLFSRRIKELDNVFLFKASDGVNSYQLGEETDFAVVYGSKLTHELAARGVPVIVAGDAWGRGKGFTYDPKNRLEYCNIVKKFFKQKIELEEAMVEKALIFCYEFYFKWAVEITSVKFSIKSGKTKMRRVDSNLLQSTVDEGLVTVVRNILENKRFW